MNTTKPISTTGDPTTTNVAAEPGEPKEKDTVAGDAETGRAQAGQDKAAEAEGELAVSDDIGTDSDDGLDDAYGDDSGDSGPTGLGAAAAAVVAAGLGLVSLSGTWTSKVASERETLIGQIHNASGGSAAQQISEIYGDAWHTTALVNGVFALIALLVGVFALVRPAFGTPCRPQAGWVRAVATAGVALGVLGVLISIGMYFDLILSMPTAPATGS